MKKDLAEFTLKMLFSLRTNFVGKLAEIRETLPHIDNQNKVEGTLSQFQTLEDSFQESDSKIMAFA